MERGTATTSPDMPFEKTLARQTLVLPSNLEMPCEPGSTLRMEGLKSPWGLSSLLFPVPSPLTTELRQCANPSDRRAPEVNAHVCDHQWAWRISKGKTEMSRESTGDHRQPVDAKQEPAALLRNNLMKEIHSRLLFCPETPFIPSLFLSSPSLLHL